MSQVGNAWSSTAPDSNPPTGTINHLRRETPPSPAASAKAPALAIGQRGLLRQISSGNIPEQPSSTSPQGPLSLIASTNSAYSSSPSSFPTTSAPPCFNSSSHSSVGTIERTSPRSTKTSFDGVTPENLKLKGFLDPSTLSAKRKKNGDVTLCYTLASNKMISQKFSNHELLKDVKQKMLDHIAATHPEEKLLDINSYAVKIPGLDHYITSDGLSLHRIHIVQVCVKTHVFPIFHLVEKKHSHEGIDIKQVLVSELNTTQTINVLLLDVAENYLQYENEEIDSFRASLAKERIKLREKLLESEEMEKYPQYLLDEPMPANVPNKLVVACYLPIENNTQIQIKADCSPDDYTQDLLKKVFQKCTKQYPALTNQKTPEDFVLKVAGFSEFLCGKYKIIDYNYIRRCISKGIEIQLSLFPFVKPETSHENKFSLIDLILSQDPEEKKEANVVSMWTITRPFRIKIVGADNVSISAREGEDLSSSTHTFFVMAELYHSLNLVASAEFSSLQSHNASNVRWNQWLVFSAMAICNIAKGTKICFTLYRRSVPNNDPSANQTWITALDPSKDVPIGWANCQIIDFLDRLQTGPKSFRLWEGDRANPIGTCVENLSNPGAPIIYVEFENFPQTVRVPKEDLSVGDLPLPPSDLPSAIKKQLEGIISRDPMAELSPEEKKLVIENRMYLTSKPEGLPKYLLSVCWNDKNQVQEAHRLLKIWKPLSPIQALELLDARFGDPEVRSYAVVRLEESPTSEWSDFLLQMTQVLKYESHHDSDLARFLLRKALSDRHKIGHAFFWHLKAEMHLAEIAERYGILLEAYLRGCGEYHRDLLLKEDDSIKKLVGVANKIKKTAASERLIVLRSELAKLELPPTFQLPLDPSWQVNGLIVEKCKYMDSKKLPLWLVFTNAEPIGKPITVIFKAGDDLRQDTLTLQMLRIMDKMWKKEGLDFLMQIYGCISTGDEIGMIQVVLNSATTANINYEAGGATKVLSKDTMRNWLIKHNPGELFEKAQENFLLSCAGYCVATYVLGIGDRHNDNIMMTKMGHLFHIDFGHFLGNFKKKFGLKRERAPFIFTPQYSCILGGKKSNLFLRFVKLCTDAYNILRKHADLFINLFLMMISTGIPELTSVEDISYLKNALCLGMSDEEAAKRFEEQIYIALKTKTVLVNDVIHVWVHN